MTHETITLKDIREARELLKSHIVRTPLIPIADPLCQISQVFMKMENFQATGSFKDRGAFVKLNSLNKEQRHIGVIAMSAGNHAQGVAFHARQLAIPATIIMPVNAPLTKVERTKALGATVIQEGETIDEAQSLAQKLVTEKGLTLVHPFDDPFIIMGQGTIGLEILEDLPEVERLIVPVGGGGLISGIAIAIKSLKPQVEIIGVEIDTYPSMSQHTHKTGNKTGPIIGGPTIADGIAVKQPGSITQPLVRKYVDRMMTISESEAEAGVFRLLESANVVAEGAGATAMGALLAYPDLRDGRKTVMLTCGGNIDLNTLSNIIRRGLLAELRVIKLRVLIDDRPGVLSNVTSIIGKLKGNILDVTHHRASCPYSAKHAFLDLTIEIGQPELLEKLKKSLEKNGFKVEKNSP